MSREKEPMHTPLPSRYADMLLQHLKTCPQCKPDPYGAPRQMARTHCPYAQYLVRMTIEERHGKRA